MHFPISPIMVLRRSMNTLALLLATLVGLLLLSMALSSANFEALSEFHNALVLKKLFIASVFILVALGRLLYEYLHWRGYDYFIDGARLHIESGVLIRREASVPILNLSEFYINRNWADLIFGTRDLIMKTALGEGQEVARIESMKEKDAQMLKKFLIRFANLNEQQSLRHAV